MRVNVYAEEMTDRVEIVSKVIDGVEYTGIRFYLYLPVTRYNDEYGTTEQIKGPFEHRFGVTGDGKPVIDDDSSAITFWGKKDLRVMLQKAMTVLDDHLILRMREESKRGKQV